MSKIPSEPQGSLEEGTSCQEYRAVRHVQKLPSSARHGVRDVHLAGGERNNLTGEHSKNIPGLLFDPAAVLSESITDDQVESITKHVSLFVCVICFSSIFFFFA